MELEKADLLILQALQANGQLTNQQLAEHIGMSASPCWRRVKRLEEEGVITGYQASVDRKTIGLGVMVFVRIQIDTHSHTQAQRFEHAIHTLDEVVGCYAIAGEADFLLQIVATDLDSYADFAMNTIRRLPGIKEMHTMFVLKEIKSSGTWPIPGAAAVRKPHT